MHLQARTTLQHSLAAAELERDQEREHSSSLQAQVDALQDQVNQVKGYNNQAAANSQVLLAACAAAVVVALGCCVVLHLQAAALAPYTLRMSDEQALG